MKKFISSALAALLLCSAASASNPEICESDPGTLAYTGDPAALVLDSDGDGEEDIVYLFVGHDNGNPAGYSMPEWLCYSSTDMVNWTYRGVPLSAADFQWGSRDQSWASQVAEYNGKYYFYMCKSATGMSVAVADTPEGPYTNALPSGQLVYPNWTAGTISWDDIDPTIWIENDENGVEHRYICWGNTHLYMSELDESMISLADLNGDGWVNGGDITELKINGIPEGSFYTEAPWIYRREGDSRYYLFFATNWREELSYAVSDNIWGPYEYAGKMMSVGASSNTNHPSVIDFKGQTYFIYHAGPLERGTGYGRSVCIDRLVFDSYGNAAQLEESSIGLDGTAVKLSYDGENVFHNHFDNSLEDSSAYPMGGVLKMGGSERYETDSLWEIVPGLIEGENHVSIQSVNKMGYYVTEYDGFVKLLHDDDGTVESKTDRTFIATETAEGTAYESLSAGGKYLSVKDGNIVLADEPVYFTLTPRKAHGASASVVDGKIIVKGVTEPYAEIAVTLTGAEISVTYAKADGDGNFSCAFAPLTEGKYQISAAGRMVNVEIGGNN